MSKQIEYNKQDVLKFCSSLGSKGEVQRALMLKYGASERTVRRWLAEIASKNQYGGVSDYGGCSDEEDHYFKGKLPRAALAECGRIIGESLVKNYHPISLTDPKLLRYSIKNKPEEVSILDISDTHVGMINTVNINGVKTTTYNHAIFLKELHNLLTSIFHIYSIQSCGYKLRKLVIHFLGDIITNDRIFKEQVFEIEYAVGLQIWEAINAFTGFFNSLLKIYEEIEIVGIVGNHGRSLPDSYSEVVENNFEYFIYKVWEKQFEGHKRIKVIVPQAREYLHTIYGWRHWLEHGDSFRSNSQTSMQKKIEQMYMSAGGFDVIHYGHFHKLFYDELSDKVIVKQNGSWVLHDSYALRRFKTVSVPKQHFFGCDKNRPQTWQWALDLRG